jgi:hypothetical protein
MMPGMRPPMPQPLAMKLGTELYHFILYSFIIDWLSDSCQCYMHLFCCLLLGVLSLLREGMLRVSRAQPVITTANLGVFICILPPFSTQALPGMYPGHAGCPVSVMGRSLEQRNQQSCRMLPYSPDLAVDSFTCCEVPPNPVHSPYPGLGGAGNASPP